MRSWADSDRCFMISFEIASGPGALPADALWHAAG